jgi:hypothetical protein
MSLAEFMDAKLKEKQTQSAESPSDEVADQDGTEIEGGNETTAEEEGDEEAAEDVEQATDESSTAADSEQEGGCESCPGESQTAFLEYIKSVYGVDLTDKYKTDHAALQGLLEAYRLVGQRNRDSEILQALRDKVGEEGLLRLLSDTAEAAAAVQAANAEQAKEEVEFDPAWLHMVQLNTETGQLEPRPGAPPEVVDKLIKFAQHRESVINEFVKNPERFLEAKLGRFVQNAIQSAFQQVYRTTSKQATLQQWTQARASVLYGPQGQLTPYGEKIASLAGTLQQHGVDDPYDALLLAGAILEQFQTPPPQPAPPAPTAAHTPNRKPKAVVSPAQAVRQVFEEHKKKGTPITLEAALRAAGLMSGEEE